MAERVLHDPEGWRQEKNWREFEPGDAVWYVPDPDENGMVDPDEIKLFFLVKDPSEGQPASTGGEVPKTNEELVHVAHVPCFTVRKHNLYLSDPKPTSTSEGIQ